MSTPDTTSPGAAEIVTAILAAAQLTVSDNELATFVKDYPVMRKAADALYLPELGLEPDEPANKFNPLDFYAAAATAPAGKDA